MPRSASPTHSTLAWLALALLSVAPMSASARFQRDTRADAIFDGLGGRSDQLVLGALRTSSGPSLLSLSASHIRRTKLTCLALKQNA